MVSVARLERLFERWAERVVQLVLARSDAGDEDTHAAFELARGVAQTAARDAAARVVTAVLAALIIQRARKSTVATVASRVASARLTEGYPVNVFHLCVSE